MLFLLLLMGAKMGVVFELEFTLICDLLVWLFVFLWVSLKVTSALLLWEVVLLILLSLNSYLSLILVSLVLCSFLIGSKGLPSDILSFNLLKESDYFLN